MRMIFNIPKEAIDVLAYVAITKECSDINKVLEKIIVGHLMQMEGTIGVDDCAGMYEEFCSIKNEFK